jgi:hypothetical protein
MALTYIVALSGKISPSGFYQNNTLTFEKGFSRNKFTWKRQAIYFFREREREELGLRCLTPLSTIFQLYRGDQFYWWRKPEYTEKTIELSQRKDFLINLQTKYFDACNLIFISLRCIFHINLICSIKAVMFYATLFGSSISHGNHYNEEFHCHPT